MRLPEQISQALVPWLIRSRNVLDQSIYEDYKFGWRRRLQVFLQEQLVNLLSSPAWNVYYEAFTSPKVYNPVKEFQPITLIETRNRFNLSDERTNFRLREGEWYLGIHLWPRDNSSIPLGIIEKSLQRMALYLDRCKDRLPSNLIVGLTYDKLAAISVRYGFQVIDVPLPPQLSERFTDSFKSGPVTYDVSNPKVCVQTCEEFIARFSPRAKTK